MQRICKALGLYEIMKWVQTLSHTTQALNHNLWLLTNAIAAFQNEFFIVPDGNVYMMRTLFNHYIWLHFFYTPINLRLKKQCKTYYYCNKILVINDVLRKFCLNLSQILQKINEPSVLLWIFKEMPDIRYLLSDKNEKLTSFCHDLATKTKAESK